MKSPSQPSSNPSYEYTFLFLHQFFGAGEGHFKEEQLRKRIEESIFNKNNFEQKLSDFDLSITEAESKDSLIIESAQKKEAKLLITSLTESYNDLKNNIEKFLKSTEWKKVDSQDKIFLLIGTHEIIKRKKGNETLVINTIIEMAKKYGDDGSAPFINGVLDQVYKTKK